MGMLNDQRDRNRQGYSFWPRPDPDDSGEKSKVGRVREKRAWKKEADDEG